MNTKALILVGAAMLSFAAAQAQIVDSKMVGSKFVFIDKNGRQVGDKQYDGAWWDGEFGGIRVGDLQTAVDSKGRPIVPLEYAYCDYNSEYNIFEVGRKVGDVTLYGWYSRSGKQLIPCEFTQIQAYERGLSVRNADGYYGVYSPAGKVIFPCEYSSMIILDDMSSDGYNYFGEAKGGTIVDKNSDKIPADAKIGMIDTNSAKIVVPFEYEAVNALSRDYIAVNRGGSRYENQYSASGGKWGVVAPGGKEIVPCEYDAVSLADAAGLFAVQQGGKWGLWANGGLVVACRFDNAPFFRNDVAMVKEAGRTSMLKNPLKEQSEFTLKNTYGDSKLASKKGDGRATSRYPAPDSDVDRNIPSNKSNDNFAAFIIANENYPDAPVPYALNNGRMFREYCVKCLGIPEKQVFMYEDATLGQIISAVERLKATADAFDGELSLIFFYAGHGVPDEQANSAFLLPVDGNLKDIAKTGYKLSELYSELSALKTANTFAFIDACFSGAKREDEILTKGRGVAIKVKPEQPRGRMMAFTASTGDETAHQLEEKHHGLFTYYLLKALQDSKGNIALGDLTDFVTKQVKRQSVVINSKRQTPTMIPSQAVADSWRTVKLR